jgi:hypothetical protein
MKVVYFGTELQLRAPEVMGVFCTDPEGQWLTVPEFLQAIERGECVDTRPASPTEMKRAGAMVTLYEICVQLGYNLGALLDKDEPEVAVGVTTQIRDAFESALEFKQMPADLLDHS